MVDVPASPTRTQGPGEPQRPAPRQARAVATREAILAAAAHEFAAEGYHAASLSKILDRSGVTKGALYFHFTSKEAMADAVVAVMERRFPEITEAFEGLGYDPMTTAVAIAIGIADVFAADVHVRGGMRAVGEGVLGPERFRWAYQYWDDVFLDLFGRARDAGLIRAGVDAGDLARTVVALGNGHRVVSTATTGQADLRDRAVRSWELLLGCVADAAWLERWEAAGGMASLPLGNPLPGVVERGPDPVP
ncbi:ScbR family autoregulator-binding transcription factor [Actinomycetospora corticicola]|uniref:AcrR family transcriptional regulator n=1 Tax=Actinomycetospora corticicola TaxID=663602 RepID=A0A7Y9DYP3_9PSEU|nr:ScbR family autoregulator-binding transcription factor [Actinomycetospora corticicola]NYD37932.1 AcrR family transcriptional regulator [Actinomycetospora corticicola]